MIQNSGMVERNLLQKLIIAYIDLEFYNNCLISRVLIGSFLSLIRVRTDKILIYARFQHFNVQLSNCQLFNQWDFIEDKFRHNIVKVYCGTTRLRLVFPQPL